MKDCLVHIKGNKALEKHFKGITDLSDEKQKEKAISLAKSYFKGLHNELENFKKEIDNNYTPKPFLVEDKEKSIKEIKTKYQKKIDKIKESISEDIKEQQPTVSVEDALKTEDLTLQDKNQKDETKSERKEKRIEEFNKKVDAKAKSLIDFLTPKTTRGAVKSGMGIEEIVNGAATVIKAAYAAKQNIQEAVEAGIDFFKEKWNVDELGELPEDALREKLINDFSETEDVKEPAGKMPYGENSFLYIGSKEERVRGLMRHITEAKGISDQMKESLSEKINYKVANNEEARTIADAIVKSMGSIDALSVARGADMHPSVRSAIYASLIDNAFNTEVAANKNKDADAAMDAARQWADLNTEYGEKLTEGGQFTSYAAHFYKQSPMGFIIQAERQREQRIDDFLKGKEADYKEVFNVLKSTQEGSAIIEEEVEKIRKEERKERRKSRDKKIDDFFDKAFKDISSGTYSTIPFAPQALKLILEAARVAVKAGGIIADVVKIAIEALDKEAKGAKWDKDRIAAYLTEGLQREAEAGVKEGKKTLEQSLRDRKEELLRRINEKDFSNEEYKGTKTLSESEQNAKNELAQVEKIYNDLKKKSDEWIDKKSKQYLDQLSKKLKGLNDEQKMKIINMALKKIVANGGLKIEEFRDIIAKVVGIKQITAEQVATVDGYMKDINAVSEVEDELVKNPTKENRNKYEEAQRKSLEATLGLHNMLFHKSDIIRTFKSMLTAGLLGVPTLIKNVGQNVILQSTVRFPSALLKQIRDLGVYGVTSALSKVNGNIKPVLPKTNILKAQSAYFGGLKEGLSRAIFNFKKGTIEADIFGSKEYQSNLAPKIAAAELAQWKKGELFLTKTEILDRYIRKSIFGKQANFILKGMQFGDSPQRWATEKSKAVQIATMELGLVKDEEIEAFLDSPKKYATKVFLQQGKLPTEAAEAAQEIEDRIISEGEQSVLQSPTLISMASEAAEKSLKANDTDSKAKALAKRSASLLKTITFPFVKIPSNAYWLFFKASNPALTLAYSVSQAVMSKNYRSNGDIKNATKYEELAKNNLSIAVLGTALSLVATSMVAAGLVRGGDDDDDEMREIAGEKTFGKQRQVNIGKLYGGSDYWVDLSWLGPLGSVLDIKSRMVGDAKDRKRKGEKENGGVDNFIDNFGYSLTSSLNSLIFDQGAKIVNAIKGGEKPFKTWTVQTLNTIQNAFTGATYTAISKAMLPEQTILRADNTIDEIKNNLKQRNAVIRMFAGRPPTKMSVWGEPIKMDNSIKGVLGGVLGFEGSNQNLFGVILYNDAQKSGDARFFPPFVSPSLSIDGKSVRLSSSEYDDLQKYIGQARKNLVTPFIENRTSYKNTLYKNIKSDKDKVDALEAIYSEGRKIGVAQFKADPKYSKYITAKDIAESIKDEKESIKKEQKDMMLNIKQNAKQ